MRSKTETPLEQGTVGPERSVGHERFVRSERFPRSERLLRSLRSRHAFGWLGRQWTLGLLLALAGLVAWGGVLGCKKAGGDEGKKGDEVIPVEVSRAKLQVFTEEVSLAGEVLADVEVRVLSLVAERIVRLNFEEGQVVKKGQLLALIKGGPLHDSVRQAKAGLQAAKTQLKLAGIELERTKKLYKSGALPIATLQRAEAQFNAAQAQVAQMQAMLSQSYTMASRIRITAPVSGIIGQRFLNKGDMAGPQVPLCTIIQMDKVRVKGMATELDLVKLHKGQPVHVTVPAYPHRTWQGKVDYISPVLDRATRTAPVTVLVDNEDLALRPGMFADLVVETGRRSGVVTVPARAVVRRVGADETIHHEIFVLDGDRVRAKKVVLGERRRGIIEIRKGLSAGEQVVTLGVFRLRDGAKVRVVQKIRAADGDEAGGKPSDSVGSQAPGQSGRQSTKAPGTSGVSSGGPGKGGGGGRPAEGRASGMSSKDRADVRPAEGRAGGMSPRGRTGSRR